MGRNAHKSTFVRGSLPTIFGDEDRRFQQCEQPFIVLASVADGSMYKNDVTHVFQNVILSGDTVTISIEKNGQVLPNRGTSVFYPNSPNAVGFIFDWRQYLQNEGAGCYSIKLECVLAGVNINFTWGNYELSPWTIDSAMNTVRVYSRFNSYALNHNIDFSGSNAVDSIRFNGFFGNMQPNTKVNNLKANNNVQTKVTRENLKTYELTSDLLNVCHTKRLIDLHFLHENTVWISDHNPQNHSYDYRDIELIVKEVPEVDYKKDVRGAIVSCVFEDKQPYYKSRYRTSSPLGDVTPSPTCDDGTVNVNKSDGVLISAVTVTSGGTEPYNVADSIAVLKDTAGTTISTTPIKATESEDITAPDVSIDINGVTEGTHVAGSTIGINLTDGTNPVNPDSVTKVGDNYEVVVPASTGWKRNPDWLPLPEITAADNRFVGLFLVFENEYNQTTIQATSGAANIDWGDGTSDISNGGIQTKVYDYATISSPVNQYYDGRNYKQVVVDVTTLTSINFFYIDRNNGVNNNGVNNYGDFNLSFSNTTNILLSENRLLEYLETFKMLNIGTSSIPNFRHTLRLKDYFFGANTLTRPIKPDCFFRGLNVDKGVFNFLGTSATTMFYRTYSQIIDITLPEATVAISMFRESSIRKLVMNIPLMQNLATAFYVCRNANSITIISGHNINDLSSAFDNCADLSHLIIDGCTIGFSVANCNMSAQALNVLFTSLGTASGSQTIIVTGNPGAATCDTTIATAKGFTVTT